MRVLLRRYGFAVAYLAGFVAAELAYTLLDPDAQARLIAWASTNVANLEHEPVGPLLVSAFVTPGFFAAWPVLIAPALFGANRALGNTRTALVCLAGHVIGSLVSEGILAYRIDAGQLSAANRHITDVGPSYVVLSAIVIALACGGWLARTLAAVDLVVLVFPGQIFGGLSQLDVRRGRAPDRGAHRRRGHRPHPVPPEPEPEPEPEPQTGTRRRLRRPRDRRPPRSGR